MARPRIPIDWLAFLAFSGVMTSLICGGVALLMRFESGAPSWNVVPTGCWIGVGIGLGLIALPLVVYFCGLFEIVNVPGGMGAAWLPPAGGGGPSPIERLAGAEETVLLRLPTWMTIALYAGAMLLLRMVRVWGDVPLFAWRNGEEPWTLSEIVMLGGGTMVVLLILYDGLWRAWRANRRGPSADT